MAAASPAPRYLDPEAPIDERVEDLLARMTLEEKAGQLFHPGTLMSDDGTLLEEPRPGYGMPTTHELVVERHITHMNLINGGDARTIAQWHNRLQEQAAGTRLAIPVTVSTDPRHGVFSSPLTGMSTQALSRWPEHSGLAALPDAERRVEEYGDIVRREYLALGIRVALGPMADIFSDPRWSRGSGTFGEDPATVARLSAAFIRGLQGPGPGPESVAAMVKHFPGGGPQKDGEDAHDSRYPDQVYPGGQQELHLEPFRASIEAGARQVMTYYGRPLGAGGWDEVGFAFNRPVVQGLLREQLGFDGIVCTDWHVIGSTSMGGISFGPNAYGLEDASPAERIERALDAGVDQFGGDRCTELIVELVRDGRVDEARIDTSVRRVLREKFRMGLFEHRYVDPDKAAEIVGAAPLRERGEAAQRDSVVLLKNDGSLLPLRPGTRVYAEGIDTAAFAGRATTVSSPEDADVAVVRLHAPYDPDQEGIASFFHRGTLEFPAAQTENVRQLAKQVPTVVSVYLERPAVLTSIETAATAVLGDFGSNDTALADILTGAAEPRGSLPFDLPSSAEAVAASREDTPFDTNEPLHRFGFGLHYGK
ncbi:glycoside hydrolase family 3 protein [Amycolatopsis granulosa]|uniref:glycoside hydrolase family 3 protein n=1 Tax=Amycolatopsis granulosa TaxID=185684 RepID=UPI001421A4DF|nr:glycoside hydrolase family 3 protein [Amycolatopsis granulosa]NIH87275.1 beta-glucosidase [Amycolatopsis granulosa]